MKHVRRALLVGLLLSAVQHATLAQAPSVPPSPQWNRAMPPGPDVRVRITEAYAKQVGRDTYFSAWPMVNIYNRRLHFATVTHHARVGPLMESPLNELAMLTDYVAPEERSVACPNQDVVYGIGALALDLSPGVIYVQADAPTDPEQRANWLPAPQGDFSLYVRAYWPKAPITDGSWTPPAVTLAK